MPALPISVSFARVRLMAAVAVCGLALTATEAAAQESVPTPAADAGSATRSSGSATRSSGSATRSSGSATRSSGSTTRAGSAAASDASCLYPGDAPISTLSVDITPRDLEGLPVDPAALPVNCWNTSGLEWGAVFLSCNGGCSWNCHELLQLARFCHRPLYFEATAMERCGVGGLFPGVRATGAFALDGFLWPVRMLTTQRPRSCVRTPTPHCCPPDHTGPCCP